MSNEDWNHSGLKRGDRLRPRSDMTAVIARGYAVDEKTGCWVWLRQRNKHGYGHVCVGSRLRDNGSFTGIGAGAHRVAYELLVGPISPGLHLDHLCRNRACVNPDHLEPVTPRENVARGMTSAKTRKLVTECKRGHGYTAETTRVHPNGSRSCKVCSRNLVRLRRSRAHSKLNASDVLELRAFYFVGGWSYHDLAEAFGIVEKTAYRVATGKSWRHLPMPHRQVTLESTK